MRPSGSTSTRATHGCGSSATAATRRTHSQNTCGEPRTQPRCGSSTKRPRRHVSINERTREATPHTPCSPGYAGSCSASSPLHGPSDARATRSIGTRGEQSDGSSFEVANSQYACSRTASNRRWRHQRPPQALLCKHQMALQADRRHATRLQHDQRRIRTEMVHVRAASERAVERAPAQCRPAPPTMTLSLLCTTQTLLCSAERACSGTSSRTVRGTVNSATNSSRAIARHRPRATAWQNSVPTAAQSTSSAYMQTTRQPQGPGSRSGSCWPRGRGRGECGRRYRTPQVGALR